ncbi:MAG: carboxypeptidase-like regulatory domain-containing protein [Dysgonomonas sp.]|nr:carboxypeptidase-like regulatory domain-containing protein [Dysgonomonas sp.]
MNNTARNSIYRLIVWILLIFSAMMMHADDGVLSRKIKIDKNKGSVYQLLKQVSDQSGYLFVYDSKIVDNDAVVKVKKGEYSVQDAIYLITGNRKLKIRVLGNHILLNLPEDKVVLVSPNTIKKGESDTVGFISLSGKLFDHITDEPISFGSIGVVNTTIGTISNQDGEFKLVVPDTLVNSKVRFSHVGYQNHEVDISLLAGQDIRLSLEPKVFPLQEIVIRVVNPIEVLEEMMNRRSLNYSQQPAYLTTFYREGIDYKKKTTELTEGVLKVYKTGFRNESRNDQVKLLKMRRVIKPQRNDTIFPKMKSGINACLLLDVVKDIPDFLERGSEDYIYTHTDITVIDDRRVNVISFEQKDFILAPMYKGELYIDAENYALVRAHFQLNPLFIEKATSSYIAKKDRNLKVSLQKAEYIISYKQSVNGVYYINHIRGDLSFKTRKKRQLTSSPLNFWFEMVNCKIDEENVVAFPRKERLSPFDIFSNTRHSFDKDFWGNFNIILPEDKLQDMIINNLNEIVDIL